LIFVQNNTQNYQFKDDYDSDNDVHVDDVIELPDVPNANNFPIVHDNPIVHDKVQNETEQQRFKREKNEMKIILQKLDVIEKEQNRLENELVAQENNSLRLINNPSVKFISHSFKDILVDVECSICIHTPKLIDSCITNCNHIFCKSCLHSWINHIHGINTLCPFCRLPFSNLLVFSIKP